MHTWWAHILKVVLDAGDPRQAVARAWSDRHAACARVLAFGKGSLEMARAARERLPGVPMLVVGPASLVATASDLADDPNVELLPADHPTPSARNLRAAGRVERFVRGGERDEDLLVLISGGGSAYLSQPVDAVRLEQLADLGGALMRAGAPIEELNAVRKHLERLKGGRLAAMRTSRRVRALVLSDVIGDPLDTISSGPFAPDPTTYDDALACLARRGLLDRCAPGTEYLRAGARGEHEETPKPGDPIFEGVEHEVIASNAHVVRAVESHLRSLGYAVEAAIGRRGEAGDVARWLAARARGDAGPSAWVVGGEWTVDVGEARGIGGASQELALWGAVELAGVEGVRLLAFSTDGIDGPTDAAGAVVTGATLGEAARRGIDARRALAEHDSHTALGALGLLVRTGATGTNVNHVVVCLRGDAAGSIRG